MKIAISTDGNSVSPHFGRCPSFTIVEIEGNKLVRKEIIDNPGHHPGYLPEFLQEMGVKYIIAGGMGQRAQGLFAETGIQTIMGITGNVDDVIQQILDGTLEGGESLCKPGAGKGYGLDRTDANIDGINYSGGREQAKEGVDDLRKQAKSFQQQMQKINERIAKLTKKEE